mgnify:CR=1 FL=1
MLIAAGFGTNNLQDITARGADTKLEIDSQQGVQHDTLTYELLDPLSISTLEAEEEIVVLDEQDPAGWPAANLLLNPSFEGTYSGTSPTPPSWFIYPAGAITGVTSSADTTHQLYGSACWSLAISTMASGTSFFPHGSMTPLPVNERGAVLTQFPYTLSFWLNPQVALTNLTVQALLSFYDATQTVDLQDTTITCAMSNTGWFRYSVTAMAPAGAVYAYPQFIVSATNATNSGTILIDGAQLEYQTFSQRTVPVANYPLTNPTMAGTLGPGNIPTGWQKDGNITGVSYLMTPTPSLYGTACQVSVGGLTLSSNIHGITQNTLPIDTTGQQTYLLTMTLQVTAALTNGAGVRFGINYYSADGTFLSTVATNGYPQQNNAWTTIACTFGAGTSNPIPATAAYFKVFAGILSNTSTLAVGAITIGAITCQRALPQAGASGVYPTPFTDPASGATHKDLVTSTYYRQLRLFGGFIRDLLDDYSRGPERIRTIKAVDYGVMLAECRVVLTVQSQTDVSAIAAGVTYVKNLSSLYLLGMDTSTYVTNIGTVDYFQINWQTLKDLLDKISNQTVAAYWVDPYKMLHYTPALAVSAPFALSSNPDLVSTFPFHGFQYETDSTLSISSIVVQGGEQISAPQSQSFSGTGSQTAFTLNSGAPIVQVISLTVGGTGQTVGLASVNTFAEGYAVLLDPNAALLTFQTAPPVGTNNVVCSYTFAAPVLIQNHNAAAEGSMGSLRRKITKISSHPHISSQQSAIDRANAELNQFQKGRPMSTIIVDSPQAPVGVPLTVGMAVAVTHSGAGFTGQLFQIQTVKTTSIGPGAIRRELGVGFYVPDFALIVAGLRRQATATLVNATAGTVLDDVQSTSDGWAVTDSASASKSNAGVWAPPNTSTWNSTTYVWN